MRYIIGIDLGTTNCCCAYVDTADAKGTISPFRIPQLTVAGYMEARATLPSFCYLSTSQEFPAGSLNLPWKQNPDFCVGHFAQIQGANVPTRLVQSAKSWLCHTAANRRDKILPMEVSEEGLRISPIEATARYLSHIKDAWNDTMGKGDPEAEFENQEVILTVPASFDEVARTLTVEAAHLAGFTAMTLLEEPQAAFYSWISQHEKGWEQQLHPGSCILVCDVGGGTTDFSLIEVSEQHDKVVFQRMAVGDHLLLGGDNMDEAITHSLEAKLSQRGDLELSRMQWLQLRYQARTAKETLLSTVKGQTAPESFRGALQGTGSSVVKGTRRVDINQEEMKSLLLEGFFGHYTWEEALRLQRKAGFRTMGLPYEDEPSITKHLAHFLKESGDGQNGPKKPDFVLFNGGAMKPILFQEAIIRSLSTWFPEKKITVLPSYNLDLAVARGAAYYGKVRRGMGVRIGGGMARGYYLILDIKEASGDLTQKALALLPRGSEEGSVYQPERTFLLTPNRPVVFQLGTSHVRLHDKSGDLISIDSEEMQLLPPIHTVLRFGKKQTAESSQEKIPVYLHIGLTPIGTLEMSVKSQKTEHQWALEFQLRSASGQENSMKALDPMRADQTFDKEYFKIGEEIIREAFGTERSIKPKQIMEKLEEKLGLSRRDWPPSLLRSLGDAILKQAQQRKISTEYESRWWNLTGFVLRPGFGYPLDDFRLKDLWKIILGDLKLSKPPESQIQQWICYRRVAGGFNKGQQMQLISDILVETFNKKNGQVELKSKGDIYAYSEKIRAVASMELLDLATKIKVGNALAARIANGNAIDADFWALGRIGARHLLYGSLVNVVPSDTCSDWVQSVLKATACDEEQILFTLGQLARKTEHREINLSQKMIDQITERFSDNVHSDRLKIVLTKESPLTLSEQERAFGDRLPSGLLLEE
jgi:molecular chaperone DnaK (HSP70)